MDKTITPQNDNPSFDVEKFVKRMTYWIGIRTGEMVLDFWNDVSINEGDGGLQEVEKYLKDNNLEFNLYDDWKHHNEIDPEEWDEEEVA